MSKHGMPDPGKRQNDDFEREDVSTTPLFGFLIGLVVTGVLVYYLIWGMFHFMSAYERKHEHTKSPMVSGESEDARREPDKAATHEEIKQLFPEPRLEDDERTEINDFRYQQDETLASYSWVDQSAGVVRIPIDQAMKLIAQRGLPTIPQAGVVPAAASSPKAPAVKAAGKGAK